VGGVILVFILVFAFLWGYMKKFPRPHKLKMILIVTCFSIFIAFVISCISVSYAPIYRSYNPILAQLSLPSYLDGEGGIIANSFGSVKYKIFLADIQLWEERFGYNAREGYIFRGRDFFADYTSTVFYQLLLFFMGLNIIGAPLAAITYKIGGKFVKGLVSRVYCFHERARSNRLYDWLIR